MPIVDQTYSAILLAHVLYRLQLTSTNAIAQLFGRRLRVNVTEIYVSVTRLIDDKVWLSISARHRSKAVIREVVGEDRRSKAGRVGCRVIAEARCHGHRREAGIRRAGDLGMLMLRVDRSESLLLGHLDVVLLGFRDVRTAVLAIIDTLVGPPRYKREFLDDLYSQPRPTLAC
jgi:hypothetical protein